MIMVRLSFTRLRGKGRRFEKMNETTSNSASSGAVSKLRSHPCYPCMMLREKAHEHVQGITFLLQDIEAYLDDFQTHIEDAYSKRART